MKNAFHDPFITKLTVRSNVQSVLRPIANILEVRSEAEAVEIAVVLTPCLPLPIQHHEHSVQLL